MGKVYTLIIVLLMGIHPAYASDNPKHKLKTILEQAERNYLTDDFEQLKACISKYDSLFSRYKLQFGDSADVYSAYYYKMKGVGAHEILIESQEHKVDNIKTEIFVANILAAQDRINDLKNDLRFERNWIQSLHIMMTM